MEDTNSIMSEVEALEPRVERLKSLYQQYFMGIEKIPPNVLRKDVDRTIWRLRKLRFQSTRLRFKFQQIIQRYNTYQQYWKRVMREMEAGTYHRDVVRATKRFGETEVLTVAGRRARAALGRRAPPPDEQETAKQQVWELPDELAAAAVGTEQFTLAENADDWEDDEPPTLNLNRLARGITPALGAPAPPDALAGAGTARKAPPPTHTDRKRQIYDEYVRARRAAGESTEGISYERLARSLDSQTELLRKKHGGDKVIEYVVVTKDGRTLIKPRVK